MPRLAMTKEQKFDLRVLKKKKSFTVWLIGTLNQKDIPQKEAAAWLKITQQALSYKIRANAFTLEDMLIFFHKLGTEPDDVSSMLTWEDR